MRNHLKRHLCELAADGLYDCIAKLSDRPLVVCSRCGVAANSVRNVCATRWGLIPLNKRPKQYKSDNSSEEERKCPAKVKITANTCAP